MPVAHTASETGHGRTESRSIKTCGIDPALGQLLFPEAVTAIRLHRRRQIKGRKQSRTTVYAVTSLDAHQAVLPSSLRSFADIGLSRTGPTWSGTPSSAKTPAGPGPAPHPAP